MGCSCGNSLPLGETLGTHEGDGGRARPVQASIASGSWLATQRFFVPSTWVAARRPRIGSLRRSRRVASRSLDVPGERQRSLRGARQGQAEAGRDGVCARGRAWLRGAGVPALGGSAREDRGARAVQRQAAQGVEGKAPGRVPAEEAAKAKAAEALALELESDPLSLEGTELLWLPAAGTQTSDLDLKALERAVGPWTMRTMGTVEQIAAKLC